MSLTSLDSNDSDEVEDASPSEPRRSSSAPHDFEPATTTALLEHQMTHSTIPSTADRSAPGQSVAAPAGPSGSQQDAVRLRRRTLGGAVLPAVTGLLAALAVAVVSGLVATHWAIALLWVGMVTVQSAARRHRSSARDRARADVTAGLVLSSAVALTAVAGLLSMSAARGAVGMVLAAAAVTSATRLLEGRGTARRRVVLVGSLHDVESFADSVRDSDDTEVAGCHVVGAGSALLVPAAGVPTTTSLDALEELVHEVGAATVLVVPGRETDSEVIRRLTWSLEDAAVTVSVLTPVAAVSPQRLRTTTWGEQVVLEVSAPGAPRVEARVKGVVDRLGAMVLLVATSPLLAFLVAAVRLDSKGTGFFVQTRVGRNGELFRMFKLRTMFVDAEEMKHALLEDNEADGVLFKIRRDPRVTRLGFWLRRMSLDELPQLINVALGEMSLIGPRPALPSEVASYDDIAVRRLAVKPGITGLWQVSGRSDLLWDESLQLDLYYADNWRLADDLGIAARTVSAVTRGRGAY